MARMRMSEVKRMHKEAGGHFFDAGAVRMFRSRVESSLYECGYFVTSEQFGDSSDDYGPRVYQVRHFWEEKPADILTVGGPHESKSDAVRMIRALQSDAADALGMED